MSRQSQAPSCHHGYTVHEGKHPNGEACAHAQINQLNKANSDIIRRLKMNAGIDVDPTGERLEFLIEFMTQIGLLSFEQREQLELSWAEHFNNRLVKAEAEVIARIKEAAEEERRAGAAARLGVQPSRGGLIVPGHTGRQNGTGRRRRG